MLTLTASQARQGFAEVLEAARKEHFLQRTGVIERSIKNTASKLAVYGTSAAGG